jgi:hypothetical protein
VPYELADALVVELGLEELSVRRLQPREMEREPAGPTGADLHGREVTESRRRRPQRVDARGMSVDLDVQWVLDSGLP